MNYTHHIIKEPTIRSKKRTNKTAGDCVNGEIRLVGGFTYREGRVEGCVDGRWGTVCNNIPELPGAVCSQLGYPSTMS